MSNTCRQEHSATRRDAKKNIRGFLREEKRVLGPSPANFDSIRPDPEADERRHHQRHAIFSTQKVGL